jgi:secreted PhoX family phosphatase
MFNRRHFNLGLTSLAFAGLGSCTTTPRGAPGAAAEGYGPLVRDPAGLLDLPPGFAYRVISSAGEAMADGFVVPDRADGMGAFPLDADRTILVRNHELAPNHTSTGPFRDVAQVSAPGFDRGENGLPLPGGTTTLVYNRRSGRVESQHLSLVGTIRNCAGGVTPWGSWLTCEENVSRAGKDGLGQDHGWVFEVPSRGRGLAAPAPLKAMGRFNHEAAAVDPRTGIVYLTEDREDGLFYRFIPNVRGQLARGGRLQAMVAAGTGDGTDTRNWSAVDFPQRAWRGVRWIDLDNVEAPEDDLRKRGHAAGGLLFARGEGIWYGADGKNGGEFFFTCTNGGAAKLGQIMRYRPSRFEGQSGEAREPGRLQNFVESTSPDMLNYGDNITVAPHGHLIVCEDQYTDRVTNHLRGITPEGRVYPFALLHENTELAGACFSGDGSIMFVNIYSPAKTVAITGPWRAFRA